MLTTFGSLGDLHPYLALGQELARRGHRPAVATTESFRERVGAAGLDFFPVRCAIFDRPSQELVRRVFGGFRGVEFLVREVVLPSLRTAYEDTCEAAAGADLLVAHPLTPAAAIVAEQHHLPWVSTQLAPTGMPSAHDPPWVPGLTTRLQNFPSLRESPLFWRLVLRAAERLTDPWFRPLQRFRAELGLRSVGNPFFAAGQSPFLGLALFSPLLGAPQPDWPAQTVAAGFPFFDQALPADPVLEAFLSAGPPPVVFTLGSSAVMDAGSFFAESAEAARRLGVRALLLGAGPEGVSPPPGLMEAERGEQRMLAWPYGSYAQIFPKGAAVVHQGGVGTTAEALRAGRPMLIVPFGADQPDNAARMKRLGVARVLGRRGYRADRVASELGRLLEPDYIGRAAEIGEQIRAEDGARSACDAIEALLRRAH